MVANQEMTESRRELAALLQENREGLLTCVHCGLCLPSCPTYRVLGNENDSPRGRIYLMRGVIENRIEPTHAFISHIDLCLGCRACETVCPSGVPYGQVLEAARAEVAAIKEKRKLGAALMTRFILNQVFSRPGLLGLAMTGARWLRDSGIARMALEARLVDGRLRLALALLLSSSAQEMGTAFNQRARTRGPVEASALKRSKSARVAVLRGCVMEGLFKSTNRATERVLERNGCEIVACPDQACCGALHAHAGQLETARRLARRNIDCFDKQKPERIIVNAAGCGAAMKEYAHLLKDDPVYRDRAREFGERVRDACEYLVEIGMAPPAGRIEAKVTYDAPCHLMHAQRIVQAPVEVLRAIPGIELVPLKGYESCCGGAGIYNLLHPDISSDILAEKLANITASGAGLVATSNPGCLMQIGAGLILNGIPAKVVQPVDLLDAAYSAGVSFQF
jgi:glycolate oxidase iron-sulfur subunit